MYFSNAIWGHKMKSIIIFRSPFKWSVLQNILYNFVLLLPLAPKTGYSQGATPYTQTQQTRQVTTIKPATPSPATSTFSIYPVSSAVQPAAAASVVPSYSQSPTYSTNAVTYSGKNIMLLFKSICGLSWFQIVNLILWNVHWAKIFWRVIYIFFCIKNRPMVGV